MVDVYLWPTGTTIELLETASLNLLATFHNSQDSTITTAEFAENDSRIIAADDAGIYIWNLSLVNEFWQEGRQAESFRHLYDTYIGVE